MLRAPGGLVRPPRLPRQGLEMSVWLFGRLRHGPSLSEGAQGVPSAPPPRLPVLRVAAHAP